MFIGHLGVGFGAKKIDKNPSLGTLLLAAQFLDLLWPIMILLGWEKVKIEPGNTVMTPLNFISYPFTHSLFGAFVLAMLFGLIYFLIKKNYRSSILLSSLVMSHWVLDLISHRPDLQIIPWSEVRVGIGLWNHYAAAIVAETLIYLLGVFLYTRFTKPINRKGTIGMWGLVVFLAVIYLMNLFGSAPPSVNAIAIVGLFQWLIIAWAYWVDKNRTNVAAD